MASNIEIFLCYARRDEPLLKELEIHLGALQRQDFFHVWYDRDIMPGKERALETDMHLSTAQIILLLVSPDFMNSDYCYLDQMMQAMERHERGEACVIPVILRPVYYEKAPFAKLQPLPTNAEPVISSKWYHPDEAFYNVAEGIRKAAVEIAIKLSVNSPITSLQVVAPSPVVKEPKLTKSRKHQYKPGDKVRHFKFGEGIILKSEIKQGTEFVEVQFQSTEGKRRMNLQIVRLDKL
jgi:TIR domain